MHLRRIVLPGLDGGIYLGLHRRRGGEPKLEEETATYVAAMSVAPSVTRKVQLNTLIIALKAAGVWTKLTHLYIMAAHDAQAGLLNAKQPGTNTLTLGSGTGVAVPAFTLDRGYRPANGNNGSWLATGYTPPVGTRNDFHLGAWVRAAGIGVNTGVAIGTVQQQLFPYFSSTSLRCVLCSAGTNFAVAGSVGHSVISRRVSNQQVGYRNGSLLGTGAVTTASDPATPIYIGGSGVNAGSLSNRMDGQFSIAHAGQGLTDAETLALYNALSSYMTAIGA